MKLPKTNLEQKCWIVILIVVMSTLFSIVLGFETLLKWFVVIGLASFLSICIIAKKKNWISKETKL